MLKTFVFCKIYIYATGAIHFRNPSNEGKDSVVSRCSRIGEEIFFSIWRHKRKINWKTESDVICSFVDLRKYLRAMKFLLVFKFSVKDIQCFLALKICVFILSLLLTKSSQRDDLVRLKNGGRREVVCHIYDIIRGEEAMILDGIQHGESESTKVYF